jgi:PAS domain S-box-containing protein
MREDFGSWVDSETPEGGEKIRVLHVDDDVDFAELSSLFLERQSDAFEVVSEHSASEGLARLSRGDFDCIVSDYRMPGENGLEFFERIPDEYAEVPFILFTGQGSEEVASDAFSLGVTDYLQKESGTDQYAVLANRIEQAVSNARVQRRIELTRRRFRTLVEESNDAILIVTSDGTIQYATPATEHILGKSPEDIVGTNGLDPIHPDDVEELTRALSTLLERSEDSVQVDCRYRHADGSWIWIEVRGRNLLDHDDIGGVVVYVRDIDDRKANERELERRERKFRAVFEGSADAIVIADDDGVYVDANPAACELFGVEESRLLGRSIREFAPDDYDFDRAWQEFQQSEGERGLFPLVRPDGERRTVEFVATHNVLPNRHLSILRDVTGREGAGGG